MEKTDVSTMDGVKASGRAMECDPEYSTNQGSTNEQHRDGIPGSEDGNSTSCFGLNTPSAVQGEVLSGQKPLPIAEEQTIGRRCAYAPPNAHKENEGGHLSPRSLEDRLTTEVVETSTSSNQRTVRSYRAK